MKQCFALVLLLFAALVAGQAQSLDDQYVQIFGMIQEADSLAGAQPAQAMAKYTQAQTALQKLQKENPGWNSSVVSFRLGYIAERIKGLAGKVPVPAATSADTRKPTPAASAPATAAASAPALPAPPADWSEQLNGAREQVRQLQDDKSLLQAKLKEAFAAQSTQADPRELERAQEKVKSLQKENDLLKVTLEQEKAKPVAAADTKALEQTQQALAESNRQVAAQKDAFAKLALEKTALEGRLKSVAAPTEQTTALQAENAALKRQLATTQSAQAAKPGAEDAGKALADSRRELAAQKDASNKLVMEKSTLENRLKQLMEESGKTAGLAAENQSLKKQLADTKTTVASPAKADDMTRQLAQAQKLIASLQSDNVAFRLQKTALEDRVKKQGTNVFTSTVLPPASSTEDSARIRDLERERDALQMKLDSADKALYGRKGKVVAGKVEELEGQLAAMRARLEVLEARQVPYSAEELALLKTPPAKLAQPPANAGKRSVKELPAGSAKMVTEAQGYFSSKQYDKAEALYLEALKQDPKNVAVLANLAAIEVEARHFDTAETHLRQALAVEPDDAYSLYVMGILQFRQAHYDAALDALSRAAKLDPQNAEVQNYLGLTLSEKGQRAPAEAAFRKAIELQPAFGSAHVNLAVFYITQDPPYAALARYHYQKALENGHPHNPTLEKLLEDK